MRALLRRVPCLRYCILAYLKRERKKIAVARWEFRYAAFALVGHIAHNWAGIEAIIDALIEWYHPIRGRAEIQNELPVSLGKKLDYINLMIRDDGFTEDAKKGLRVLKIEAKRLGKLRSLILHGMMFRDNETATGWKVQVRDFDKETSQIVHYQFDHAELTNVLLQMSNFLHEISPWVAKLTGRSR